MKVLFVVNPISGGVNKEPFLADAKDTCYKYGIDYKIFKTTGQDDDIELKKILEDYRPDKVASVGGDGTTLFTASILKDYDYPMGIIPLGSANGMATELSVHSNPMEALNEILISDFTSGLDLVLVNDEHLSIHIGDVGINARIVESYGKDKNRGMATYAKYFARELQTTKPFSYKVETPNETKEEHAVMVGICNARKYGTGVPLSVVGGPMDGKFEIVVVEKIDAVELMRAGLSKFDESFHSSQNSYTISTESAKVTFDKPNLLQLDGEVIGKFSELEIKIIKGAVKFITHRDNPYVVI